MVRKEAQKTDSVQTDKNLLLSSNAEVDSKPTENYSDIGGLIEEVDELRSTVELPMLQPKRFEKIGVEPPKGVLLVGPPGTGKTLMAKRLQMQQMQHS